MISDSTNVVRYTTSEYIREYEFLFPFWDFSEISVQCSSSTTGESITLKQGEDYIIIVDEDVTEASFSDGIISMQTDLYMRFDRLTILRTLDVAQHADYKNGEPMDADHIENSFDRTVAICQQMKEQLGRTLMVPVSDDPNLLEFPSKELRKGRILGFSEDGSSLELYNNPDNAPIYISIESSGGNIYRRGDGKFSTTLTAHVIRGDMDVTDLYDGIRYRWTRSSGDEASDRIWNNKHYALTGNKLDLTIDDILGRCTFTATLVATVIQ